MEWHSMTLQSYSEMADVRLRNRHKSLARRRDSAPLPFSKWGACQHHALLFGLLSSGALSFGKLSGVLLSQGGQRSDFATSHFALTRGMKILPCLFAFGTSKEDIETRGNGSLTSVR